MTVEAIRAGVTHTIRLGTAWRSPVYAGCIIQVAVAGRGACNPGMESPDERFKPGEIAQRLIGAWRYNRKAGAGENEYIYFCADGRAITSSHVPERPGKLLRHVCYWEVETVALLRTRLRPGHEGWTSEFRFAGDLLLLMNPNLTFECTRIAIESAPDWFRVTVADVIQTPSAGTKLIDYQADLTEVALTPKVKD